MWLRVNGRVVRTKETPEGRVLLADFLREELGLKSVHLGCEQGICGACTVLLDGEPVKACLMLAVQADGAEVMTAEGLAHDGAPSPLQQLFHEEHALQCGFCTPGMLMVATSLLRDGRARTEADVRTALSGNLCRCTGYQGIVDAVVKAAARVRVSGEP